jgi:hypothetical protein
LTEVRSIRAERLGRLVASGELTYARGKQGLVLLRRSNAGKYRYVDYRRWFRATLRALDDGRVVVESLDLHPPFAEDEPEPDALDTDDEGLTSGLLRATLLDPIIDLALEYVRSHQEFLAELSERDWPKWMSEWATRERQELEEVLGELDPPPKPTGRGRPPSLGDFHHIRVSLDVLKLDAQGLKAGEIHAKLAKDAKWGANEREVKVSTVQEWIRQARKAGWLAPGQAGRSVFAPGPRLIERRSRMMNRQS